MSFTKMDMEKYKHDITGKFHLIKSTVDYVDTGKIPMIDGLTSIHEVLLKMNSTSKFYLENGLENILIIYNDKEHLQKSLSDLNSYTLRPILVDGIQIDYFIQKNYQFYFFKIQTESFDFLFKLGKVSALLPINAICCYTAPVKFEVFFKNSTVKHINIDDLNQMLCH